MSKSESKYLKMETVDFIKSICSRISEALEEIDDICALESQPQFQPSPLREQEGIGLLAYVKSKQEEMKKRFPAFTHNEILSILLTQWQNLSPAEKVDFYQRLKLQKMNNSKKLKKLVKSGDKFSGQLLKSKEESFDQEIQPSAVKIIDPKNCFFHSHAKAKPDYKQIKPYSNCQEESDDFYNEQKTEIDQYKCQKIKNVSIQTKNQSKPNKEESKVLKVTRIPNISITCKDSDKESLFNSAQHFTDPQINENSNLSCSLPFKSIQISSQRYENHSNQQQFSFGKGNRKNISSERLDQSNPNSNISLQNENEERALLQQETPCFHLSAQVDRQTKVRNLALHIKEKLGYLEEFQPK